VYVWGELQPIDWQTGEEITVTYEGTNQLPIISLRADYESLWSPDEYGDFIQFNQNYYNADIQWGQEQAINNLVRAYIAGEITPDNAYIRVGEFVNEYLHSD